MKGMLLAAGFGERLKPLTLNLPKPSVRLLGIPLVYYTISLLVEAGLREIVINTHYMGDLVERDVTAGFGKLDIRFSHETEILGTGGGLKKAEPYLVDTGSPDDIIVLINSDIAVDVDILAAVDFHKSLQSVATMVLRKDPDAKKYGAIYTDSQNRIQRIRDYMNTSLTGLNEYMFTGLHILSRKIFEYIPKEGEVVKKSDIISSYVKMISGGEIVRGYVIDGFWKDFGTLEKLEEMEKNPHPYLLQRKKLIQEMIDKYGHQPDIRI